MRREGTKLAILAFHKLPRFYFIYREGSADIFIDSKGFVSGNASAEKRGQAQLPGPQLAHRAPLERRVQKEHPFV